MEYIERDRDGKPLYQINFTGEEKTEEDFQLEAVCEKKKKPKDKFSKFRSMEAMDGTVLTTLSFSGGTGSGAIAEMLLNGDIVCETPLLICTADPGMEDSRTYDYLAEMGERFAAAGIEHRVIKTDLYGEFLKAVKNKATRFDNPPFWTKNKKTGKRGRLMQCCTHAYKIAPMRRIVREVLSRDFGVRINGRPKKNSVRTWIGFTADEVSRIKESEIKYTYNAYPLVAKKMTKQDVYAYYAKIGRKLPPRSVCSACFANDLSHFKDMYLNRKEDWEKAVAVDEACRDLSCMAVEDECYVSNTLVPLKDLPSMDFIVEDTPLFDMSCQSGYCFI